MICIGGHDECVGSRRIGDKGRDEAEDLLSFDHFSIYCDRISSADASEKWYAWIGGRPQETCVSAMAMIGKIYR